MLGLATHIEVLGRKESSERKTPPKNARKSSAFKGVSHATESERETNIFRSPTGSTTYSYRRTEGGKAQRRRVPLAPFELQAAILRGGFSLFSLWYGALGCVVFADDLWPYKQRIANPWIIRVFAVATQVRGHEFRANKARFTNLTS
jgi:hypothetical protein